MSGHTPGGYCTFEKVVLKQEEWRSLRHGWRRGGGHFVGSEEGIMIDVAGLDCDSKG